MIITEPVFTKFTLGWQIFVNNSNTEFHENWCVESLILKDRTETYRQTNVVSTHSTILLRKERLTIIIFQYTINSSVGVMKENVSTVRLKLNF